MYIASIVPDCSASHPTVSGSFANCRGYHSILFHLIRIAVRHLHLSILIFTIVLLIVLIFIASPLCPLRSLRLIDRHSLRRRTAKHARRGARLLGGLLRFCDLPRELEGAGEFGESVGSAFCVG